MIDVGLLCCVRRPSRRRTYCVRRPSSRRTVTGLLEPNGWKSERRSCAALRARPGQSGRISRVSRGAVSSARLRRRRIIGPRALDWPCGPTTASTESRPQCVAATMLPLAKPSTTSKKSREISALVEAVDSGEAGLGMSRRPCARTTLFECTIGCTAPQSRAPSRAWPSRRSHWPAAAAALDERR